MVKNPRTVENGRRWEHLSLSSPRAPPPAPRSSSSSKNIFRSENEIFGFIQSRDIVYVRSIKHKERVCNKSGWVLKIDIGLAVKSRGGPRTPLTEVHLSKVFHYKCRKVDDFSRKIQNPNFFRCRFLRPTQTCCRLVLCVLYCVRTPYPEIV